MPTGVLASNLLRKISMSLIKNNIIIRDSWNHLDDDTPLSAEGKVIVSLKRWQSERKLLMERQEPPWHSIEKCGRGRNDIG